nr:dTMP kinase [Longispora albida]
MSAQVDLSGGAELRSILRIRPFRRLWMVLSVSSFGDWLGLLATALFAASQASTTVAQGAAFGTVIAVRLLPALVLGPVAGVFADRFDRRYTMVACDLLRFGLFASIPLVGTLAHDGRVAITWAAVATVLIETVSMIWTPAKEASVPNLLPKARLERANQLSLIMTYGVMPVLAALTVSALSSLLKAKEGTWASSENIALYFNALTFLATALVVFFGIKEISGRSAKQDDKNAGLLGQFADGWRYVGRTPLVRGLVYGILGAFAGGGVVIGTAKFYASSLGGGDATFGILFAAIFIGLGAGIALGPVLVGALSRKRWFGVSIVLAGSAVLVLALAPHLAVAVAGAILVGVGAGMAFLAGITLLGAEVSDDVRGRVFAFVWTAVRVVLMLSISLSGFVVGLGGTRAILGFHLSSTRVLLAVAGVVGVVTGLVALRQMDDRKGIPLLKDIVGAVRRRPVSQPEERAGGLFVVFEGGEGAGKSTQLVKLAAWLRNEGHEPVVTREPGATDIGMRIRSLVLDGKEEISPRAEALLYAADRAQHVASVVKPALDAGLIVLSDRYVDSSLAYQGAGRTMVADEIAWLSGWATGSLKPDLVVLLDVDPSVGLSRAKARSGADRIEAESLAFHERVRYAFLDLASAQPARYQILDAGLGEDELAARIRERVESLLPTVQVKRAVAP